ncbi:MAG: LemA family protein [Vicinamibacteria bacterium]|nr:LemA family protein [Vicinamibacteria bacterium]MBP9945706.1 LemA family protein [Vicinamibacteria bacterium]
MGCLVVTVFLALGVGLVLMGSYNSLVGLSQAVDAQWAQVESAYQRRADLIPNLVATVSGAANFEKSTLEAVTQARASVGQVRVNPGDAASMADFERAQGGLSSALSRLLVVAEQYPDLKATANFRDLQVQLEGTENRISVERNRFNEKAQSYNTAILRMPARLFAGFFGMKEKPYFKSVAGSEKAPTVDFNFGASPAPTPSK